MVSRVSPDWPNARGSHAFTALTDEFGNVSNNLTDEKLEDWLGKKIEDINNFYYEYSYVSQNDTQSEKENTDTISQFYLVDRAAQNLQLIFPMIPQSRPDWAEGEASIGYVQIQVPIEIPKIGNTINYP